MNKKRLDVLLVEKKLAPSRQRAQALILAGKVLVNEFPVDKAGAQVVEGAEIRVKEMDHEYASRGGLKLEAALEHYQLDPKGLVCLDAGASTGGFTDCLLKRGAKEVYAVDVGYGQLAWNLRQDERVRVYERTNIRKMELSDLPGPADLAVVDVSFISLKIVVPQLLKLTTENADLVCLVKPQFEVGRGQVGKGGVVRDPEKHREVLKTLRQFFEGLGLDCAEPIPSPVLGPKGNREFLVRLRKSGE